MRLTALDNIGNDPKSSLPRTNIADIDGPVVWQAFIVRHLAASPTREWCVLLGPEACARRQWCKATCPGCKTTFTVNSF